jgi:dipeptidyl aminopeptidase/acylaminoacyl peptidase
MQAPIDVEFVARVDGSTQRYIEVRPDDFVPAKEVHLMIALHGHGGDRWQYVQDDIDECRGARDVAAKHGFLYVSPDYRTDSWMGPTAEADVVQIIQELRAKYKIGKVFLVGASMGGSSALTFTVLHPEMIDGVCGQKAMANYVEFENYQDTVAASFGGSKQEVPEEYRKRSAEFFPEKFTMPIAFTCGGKDLCVPPASVLRLSDKLKQMGRTILMIHDPEAGHRTCYDDTVRAVEWMIAQVISGQ